MSLRTRVILIAALGVGLMVSLVSVAAYVTVRISVDHAANQSLLERAYAAVSGPLADPTSLARIPPDAVGAADLRIALIYATGEGITSPGGRAQPPLSDQELAVAQGRATSSVRTAVGEDDDTYRVVAVPADNGSALVMAQSTASTDESVRQLGVVLLSFGAAGVLVAAWAAWGIGRTAVRPIADLTAVTERVARTHDLTPIPVSGTDEIARLTRSFNTMLVALDDAQQRQRRLIADAGHELRTPLTSLRTNLDLLAQSEHQPGLSPQDRAALLRDVRTQAGELSTLVGDLVELSREDPPAAAGERLDLADVVRRAVERVRPRAQRVQFAVQLHPWFTIGDANALERAATNLVDNAAKWSPPDGLVEVTLDRGVLSVADQGPGINPADLPHVFDRFYRSTEARTMPGSGLGLAIVKQVAERHGGWVRADRSRHAGALLQLAIPGEPGPAGGTAGGTAGERSA